MVKSLHNNTKNTIFSLDVEGGFRTGRYCVTDHSV